MAWGLLTTDPVLQEPTRWKMEEIGNVRKPKLRVHAFRAACIPLRSKQLSFDAGIFLLLRNNQLYKAHLGTW